MNPVNKTLFEKFNNNELNNDSEKKFADHSASNFYNKKRKEDSELNDSKGKKPKLENNNSILDGRFEFLENEIQEIDFSPGYELNERTFPSVDRLKSMTKTFLAAGENKNDPGFTKKIDSFARKLIVKVREQTLASRAIELSRYEKELQELDSEKEPNEFRKDALNFDIMRVRAHIANLEDDYKVLLQFRTLLNLQMIPPSHGGTARKAHHKEISMFRILERHLNPTYKNRRSAYPSKKALSHLI